METEGIVEETDVELCASGFDNLLLEPGLEELSSYRGILLKIGADQCAAVISDVLSWMDSFSGMDPMDVAESDPEKTTEFWKRYDSASVLENPRQLAKRAE